MRPSSCSCRRPCARRKSRPCRDPVDVRRGLGNRHRGLLQRPQARGAEAMAESQPQEDLVRLLRRPPRRSSQRVADRWSRRTAWLVAACEHVRRACRFRCRIARKPAWRPRRIRPEAAFRREGFEPPDPGAWRRHGPPRRVLGRCGRGAGSVIVAAELVGRSRDEIRDDPGSDRIGRPFDGRGRAFCGATIFASRRLSAVGMRRHWPDVARRLGARFAALADERGAAELAVELSPAAGSRAGRASRRFSKRRSGTPTSCSRRSAVRRD